MQQAEKVFLNGGIITIDEANPYAEAVAVNGEQIIAVGSNDDVKNLIGPKTQVHDFHGHTVIPGINDCHMHLANYGLNLLNVDLAPEVCPSIEEMKRKIAERAAKVGPGKWIIGASYNDTMMKELRHPNVQDLTEAAPNNPVFITRTCWHMGVANKMALKISGVDKNTPAPAGGMIDHDAHGELTGIFKEASGMGLIKSHIPRYNKDDLLAALDVASKLCLSFGITSVMDAGNLLDHVDELPSWFQASADGTLKVRCYSSLTEDVAEQALSVGLRTGYGNTRHRIGPVKFFMDGNIGAQSAYMYEQFLLPPYGTGLLVHEPEVFAAKVKKYHDAGFQIATHSIGDRCSEVVLEAYEAAMKANPRPDPRHRIEHNTTGACHIRRIKASGIQLSMQPAFIYIAGTDFNNYLGPERASMVMACKEAEDAGLPWGCSTDCPVATGNPKYALFCAISRKTVAGDVLGAAQAITPYQALRAYTANGAYLSFEENIKGRIKPGMLADFAVLSLNPLTANPEELMQMEILQTIFGGNQVYCR